MAVVALMTAVVATTGGIAQADHQTKYGGAHWSRYKWGGQVQSTQRLFWLYDRTGNPVMSLAIQQWVQSWNGQRNLSVPSAPAVMYVHDPLNAGQCGNFSLPGYSFITFCSGDPGTTGIASLEWFGTHLANPYVVIRPGGLNYGQLFTAVTHEMGHVLGLGHRPEPGTTMHAHANFDGAIHWYDQHDLDALNALYGSHPD